MCTDLSPNDDRGRVPLGPTTRARAKRFKESLQALVRNVQDQQGVHRNIEGPEVATRLSYTLIRANEALNDDHVCP